MPKKKIGESLNQSLEVNCLMKQFVKIVALGAAAALALVSCQKTEQNYKSSNPVRFYAKSIETKTTFDEPEDGKYPTIWNGTEKVGISLNKAATVSATVTPNTGGKTAVFTPSKDITDDGTGAYTFYAISPAGAAVSSISEDHSSWNLEFPASQTPLASSVDESAQILFGKNVAGEEFPEEVAFDFKHVSAYGKMTITDLALEEGETVSSITLEAEKPIVGRWFLYVDDTENYNEGEVAPNSASNILTLTTDKVEDVWFAIAPADLSGTSLKVTVATSEGTYTKTVSFGSKGNFVAGKVAKFSLSMEGVEPAAPVVYTLVKDIKDLTLESEVIIVAAQAGKAISTLQNSNNRAATDVTKEESIIADPSASVQVLTLEEGNVAGSYALATGSGYLYAASSGSNYMRTKTELDDNGSWGIEISADGVATIKALGTNSRNLMQYNSTNDIFSCYGSASQGAVAIYKNMETGTDEYPAGPELVGITVEDYTTDYTVGDTFSFDGKVYGDYSDGSQKLIDTGIEVDDSKVDMSTAGSYWVSIYYGEYGFDYEIYVREAGSSMTLSFDFSTEIDGWPTANGGAGGSFDYELDEGVFQFVLGPNLHFSTYSGSTYLMLRNVTSLGLPPVEGYRLSKVVIRNSTGCSTSTKVGVSSSASEESYIKGGEIQTFATQGSTYTYNLPETSADTMYYLYITNKNCQIIGLDLTYDEAE